MLTKLRELWNGPTHCKIEAPPIKSFTSEVLADHIRGCVSDLTDCMIELKRRGIETNIRWNEHPSVLSYHGSSRNMVSSLYRTIDIGFKVDITETVTTSRDF